MSLDLAVVGANWGTVAAFVVVYMAAKAVGIYVVARITRRSHAEALERAVLMAQGGEFAFVLYSSAVSVGILDGEANAILTAIVILSMVLTPLAMLGLRFALPREDVSLEGVEAANGLDGSVLVIGFGRFGQIASQPLLLRGIDVSIIDNDVEMIQAAANFGFKVYYGDGTRLDILHAAGAGRAQAVLVCVDKADTALRIVEALKAEFPLTKVLARAYDRGAALKLIHAGVDHQVRETFESALLFGRRMLEEIGVDPDEAEEVVADVRRRDDARFEAQLSGGMLAGRGYFKGNMPVPTPLTTPKRTGQAMNEETRGVLAKPPADLAEDAGQER
jgi:glutathione-regulated potassium-efflux system protein KefB